MSRVKKITLDYSPYNHLSLAVYSQTIHITKPQHIVCQLKNATKYAKKSPTAYSINL